MTHPLALTLAWSHCWVCGRKAVAWWMVRQDQQDSEFVPLCITHARLRERTRAAKRQEEEQAG